MGNIDWIPIADLPEGLKDGRQLLVWLHDGASVAWWREASGAWEVDGTEDDGGHITHFAELNAPA